MPEQCALPQHLIKTKLECVKLLVVPSSVCVCLDNMLEEKIFLKAFGFPLSNTEAQRLQQRV